MSAPAGNSPVLLARVRDRARGFGAARRLIIPSPADATASASYYRRLALDTEIHLVFLVFSSGLKIPDSVAL